MEHLIGNSSIQPVFGVKRLQWRKDDEHAHEADQAFIAQRRTVLSNSNFACRFCTFTSSEYQEVHHLDDDHHNNSLNNLICACNLCHLVHHLGIADEQGAGFIACIPELTQTQINNLCRAIFVGQLISESIDVRNRLEGLYAVFTDRANRMATAFGVDIRSPGIYAEILSTADDSIYRTRDERLRSLRLVPTRNAFRPNQLEFYAKNMMSRFNPSGWIQHLHTLRKALE